MPDVESKRKKTEKTQRSLSCLCAKVRLATSFFFDVIFFLFARITDIDDHKRFFKSLKHVSAYKLLSCPALAVWIKLDNSTNNVT